MEQNNEKQRDSIHPLHTGWLSKEKEMEIKARIRKDMEDTARRDILAKLSEMKEHIRELPRNTFIPVKEAPFVFSTNPAAHVLVEDVDRLKVGLADCGSNGYHDLSYEAGDEEKLKGLGGFSWDLCTEAQAVGLHETLQWNMDLSKKIRQYQRFKAEDHHNGTAWYWGHSMAISWLFGALVGVSSSDSSARSASYLYHNLDSANLLGLTLRTKERYYSFKSGDCLPFERGVHELVADLYVSAIPEGKSSLPYILEKGFTPDEGKDPDFWKVLALLLSQGVVRLAPDETNTGYELTYEKADISLKKWESLANGMKDGNLIRSYFGLPDLDTKVEDTFKKISIPEADLFRDALSCDRVRCALPAYTIQMLTDPKKGSWDLWESEQRGHVGMTERTVKKSFYARDPRQDISENGIIGIDFGTKSTVVTYLGDTNVIRPLRIGTGDLDREVRAEHFENPTVMEFKDIDQFLKAYRAREGRPYTRWDDVTTSHTAANDRKSSDDSDDSASFLGELKQWAGTDGKRLHIRDRKGHEETLPPYTTLQEGDLDPIELYAYYIGLYLNNQHMGKIYMHYILSFPVTYAKEVREHILESFRRGLRKSLPLTVVQDEECMEKFRVEAGAGEPAAYAVCALQELQKKEEITVSDEPLFYGVFDFGGGTSDFDFGTWRKAKKDKKEKRFTYVIRHFGAGGQPYLGGENLLKQLAYQVFKENADLLREKQIPFVRAPECEPFPGDETIVNDSQEAETNTQYLMEKLRPFWQREGEEAPVEFKVENMAFFNAAGDRVDAVELIVNVDSLEAVLEEKLRAGITAFFDKLLQVRRDYSGALAGTDECHILLGGRSSESPLFRKLFREAMDRYEKAYENWEEEAGRGIGEGGFFVLHDPLGTKAPKEESLAGQEPKTSTDDLYAPNGKTGVAFGLLLCRKGGKIRVVSETDTTQGEIPFQFYVGEEDDEFFHAVLTPTSTYGEWQEFEYAMEEDNEFYYTTSPSAGVPHGLSCSDAQVRRGNCKISEEAVNEDAMIYWRPTGPKTLEYVVAESKEKCESGEYTFGPKTILLKK